MVLFLLPSLDRGFKLERRYGVCRLGNDPGRATKVVGAVDDDLELLLLLEVRPQASRAAAGVLAAVHAAPPLHKGAIGGAEL